MGILKIIRNTNDGFEYMYNALNYVLYGHTDYDKRYSLNTDIDNAYEQFLLVKKYFYKTRCSAVIMQKYILFLNISRKLLEIIHGLSSMVLIRISVMKSMKMIYECNLT